MEKIIQMNHHVDDYECMWNGLEDIYLNQTHKQIPNGFFFSLAGFGSIIYLKNQKDYKVMPCLSDGRTKMMYKKMAPVIGFSYRNIENRTFSYTMKKARESIDLGNPVILGALDMMHLPYYPKFYHQESIPIHYVLMNGYDSEGVYIFDCGKKEQIKLSLSELEKSMAIQKTPLSGYNSIFLVQMKEPRSPLEIMKTMMNNKAQDFLYPKMSFLGSKGLAKMALEFPNWENEMSKEEYDKCLTRFVTFLGTVPNIPNRLKGIDEKDFVVYKGERDRMAEVYSFFGYTEIASLFRESGEIISKMVSILVDYLSHKNDFRKEVPTFLNEILHLETEAYQKIKKVLECN